MTADSDITTAYEPQVFHLPFGDEMEDHEYADAASRAAAVCGAARELFGKAVNCGQQLTVTEDDKIVSRGVFDGTVPPGAIQTTAEAIHLTALLDAYDLTVVQSAQQLRNFCTNHLIAIAGDDANKNSDRLNAIKMIGQIKDVALFEERSTVLVANMSTDQIKSALSDKLLRLRARLGEPDNITTVEALTEPAERPPRRYGLSNAEHVPAA